MGSPLHARPALQSRAESLSSLRPPSVRLALAWLHPRRSGVVLRITAETPTPVYPGGRGTYCRHPRDYPLTRKRLVHHRREAPGRPHAIATGALRRAEALEPRSSRGRASGGRRLVTEPEWASVPPTLAATLLRNTYERCSPDRELGTAQGSASERASGTGSPQEHRRPAARPGPADVHAGQGPRPAEAR